MKKRIKSFAIFFTVSILLIAAGTIASAQGKIPKAADPGINIPEVKRLVSMDSARLVELFKDLHRHPELGFMETRTSAIIAKELQSLGYKVITQIGKTGVAGILQNGEGPTLMYRADIDALPVKEPAGLPYASVAVAKKEDGTEVPVMHACGHDAHITWMLGIARIMSILKSQWKGTLVFVAQPAEELLLGADAMLRDNLYGRGVPFPDYLFGMHTRPFAVGDIENGTGVRMAGSDQFDITFHGVGGHGSAPHLAKDPVIMAATAILNYQTIVNRSVSSQNPHVITVGSITAGTANNIIPASATLKVNLRWFEESDRKLMIDGINRVDSSIALANNLPAELYPDIEMKGVAYPLKNDALMAAKINAALGHLLPADKINTSAPPIMGSEDFPLFILNNPKGSPAKKPVSDYVLIGIADPALYAKAKKEGKDYPFYMHNPEYTVDLRAIPLGTAVGAVAVLEMFRK